MPDTGEARTHCVGQSIGTRHRERWVAKASVDEYLKHGWRLLISDDDFPVPIDPPTNTQTGPVKGDPGDERPE